jgi:NitT/TauT family transport system substrate-binding protein
VRILAEAPGSEILVSGFDLQRAMEIYDGKPYPGSVLIATDTWLRVHPEVARKVSRALQKALHWIHQHSPEQVLEAVPASRAGEDKQTYIKAIRLIMPLLSRDGSMPDEAPRNVLQILSAADERISADKIDPSSTYTNEYLDPAFLTPQ